MHWWSLCGFEIESFSKQKQIWEKCLRGVIEIHHKSHIRDQWDVDLLSSSLLFSPFFVSEATGLVEAGTSFLPLLDGGKGKGKPIFVFVCLYN